MIGSWSRPIPLTGEEARLFLQDRTFALLRLAGVFALVLVVTHSLSTRVPLGMKLPELSIGAALLGLAFLARLPSASLPVIRACDSLGTIMTPGGFALVLADRDVSQRPEFIVLLIAATMGGSRAALTPSTGARTFGIMTAALAPLVLVTALHFGPASADGAASRTVQVLVWSIVIVVMTAMISKRIFGLSKSVDEARRLGQYTLDERLGEGGMGEVYRATHAMLKRPTAVKLLPAARSSEVDVKRFEREVQLTSQLTHPCTIQIYDFGRGADGTFYYAMELVDGLNLEDLVRAYGGLPPWRVARILADVCGSLAEAHLAGLVHRDIKPQNIMLCARGGQLDVVKVLDFGLVRSVKTEPDASRENETSKATHIIGTPTYMAPEAITSPDTVDAKVDLYAVGLVAFFLLSGEPAFHADSLFGVLAKHIHEPPPSLSSEIPDELTRLVQACLAKKPDERPASAALLRETLLGIAGKLAPVDLEAWWTEHRARPKRPSDAPAPISSTLTLLPIR